MRIAKLKTLLGIILAVVALLAINAPVMAQPVTSPFSGNVTIDDEPAPDGSEVAAYVGDEDEPRVIVPTSEGRYELVLFGTEADVGKPVSFKVKKAGTDIWLDAITDPESPKFAKYDLQVVDLFAFTPAAPPAVGGTAFPPNKLLVLAPWIVLLAAIVAGATIFMRRRRAQA